MSVVSSPESLAALDAAIAAGLSLFKPPDPLSLSEWSDRYAYLPRETSALPGKFQTATAEYQRGIMDAITDPLIETVVMMMGAQTGKTQIQLNAIGYFSHHDPSPIMGVMPTLDEAEMFSKNRIAKMIRDTPVLKEIYPDPKTRDSGNTLLNKEFLGGILTLVGANSPVGLASKPIRILVLDEVDRYPESAGTEGDPADLADKRTTTFWNRKKMLASTPGVKKLSRIEQAYESSDKRRYFVPCPHCGESQILEWGRLIYATEGEGDKKRPISWSYVCVNGCDIEERHKYEMIRNGEWRATAESRDGKTAGFHINALYSPLVDWKTLIVERIDAEFSVERLKTFINTRLAETWEIRGEGADKTSLEKRKEQYAAELPAGVLVLTCGVDVQKDRLEANVNGWGLNNEQWKIDHRVFRGSPSLPEAHPQSPWRELDEYLQTDWMHESCAPLRVVCTLIDSGGHHTKQVYDFCRKRELRRIYACKGMAGIGKPLVSSGNRVGPNKTLLFGVGVDTAKERLYTWLRVENPGPGFVHFPEKDCFDAEYFRQLTAEQLTTSFRNGVTSLKWVKKYERNEALDCDVYSLAAVDVLRPNFAKIAANMQPRIGELEGEKYMPENAAVKPNPKQPINPLNAFNNPWVNAWRR
jgi:phage terminase large subunit GpA-like protein